MKISVKLMFVPLIVFLQCKDKEDPIPALFDIEAKVISNLSPLPSKARVVLYLGRSTYDFEKGRNPLGDPNKNIISSQFSCFWQDLNANNLANFNDINIQWNSFANQNFSYDTLFFRVEAMQVIGSDTIFKTSDANPAFLILPDSEGNETIQKKITLKIDQ
jgi:hypothetical protein